MLKTDIRPAESLSKDDSIGSDLDIKNFIFFIPNKPLISTILQIIIYILIISLIFKLLNYSIDPDHCLEEYKETLKEREVQYLKNAKQLAMKREDPNLNVSSLFNEYLFTIGMLVFLL